LVTIGPRSSVIGLVAAALDDQAIDEVELQNPMGSLKEVIERNQGVNQTPELFCFGLLKEFDIRQLAALVAPRPLVCWNMSARGRQELQPLKEWFELLDGSLLITDSEGTK